MNVLVTGGAGYIGCNVVEQLAARGHQVTVFDNLLWGTDALNGLDYSLIEGDCRNSRDVIYALEDVDAIIHLAGIVGEAASNSNPKAHFSVNVESTRTLINCCTDPSLDLVRDFIFVSSCSVYGNVNQMYDEVTEDTPAYPLSNYAWAKLRSEQIILNRGIEIQHFHPTILRLSTAFGWSNRPRLDLVTNLFTYQAWKNKHINIYGKGTQYRSLIHVKDIASSIIAVLESPRYKRGGRTFNVGDMSNNLTVREIAETVQRIIPRTKIDYHLDKPSDRRDYSINCLKIKNIIGWQSKISVEEGIRDLVSHLENDSLDWDSDLYRNNRRNYK